MSLIGGGSGGAFNPGRLLGPAIFSGRYDYIYLYWIAELCGASFAALLVSNMHRFGLKITTTSSNDDLTAKQVAAKVAADTTIKAKSKSMFNRKSTRILRGINSNGEGNADAIV